MIACLKDQLLRDEGLKLKPYHDSVGKLTIGVGRNLDDDGISITEATAMLAADIQNTVAEVQQAFPWSAALDPVRLGALQNLAFNLGIAGLKQFVKFLAAMQSGDWAAAGRELVNSTADHQEPLRIQRLVAQIQTGVWQ